MCKFNIKDKGSEAHIMYLKTNYSLHALHIFSVLGFQIKNRTIIQSPVF